MLAQFNTDLAAIFADNIFHETFTHTYLGGGGGSESIEAIYDEDYVEILRGIESSNPAITIQQADMSLVATGSTFTRVSDSTVYKIKRINPEDNGLITIVLTKDNK